MYYIEYILQPSVTDSPWQFANCVRPCFDCSEWSAIEREMGDGLQSAGHHMDA